MSQTFMSQIFMSHSFIPALIYGLKVYVTLAYFNHTTNITTLLKNKALTYYLSMFHLSCLRCYVYKNINYICAKEIYKYDFFFFFSIQKRKIYKTKKDNTILNTRDKKSYQRSTAHKVNKNNNNLIKRKIILWRWRHIYMSLCYGIKIIIVP